MTLDAGRPTSHELRAALRVARTIDASGNWISDVHGSYVHVQTQGEHRSDSFIRAEHFLVDVGLLIRDGARLVGTAGLHALAQLDDEHALVALARHVEFLQRDEDTDAIGNAGELAVVAACRDELLTFGRTDLANQVAQVSLVDDAAGYDVRAPLLSGGHRLLEVKTSTSHPIGLVEFFLTRNEYDTGLREPTWAMVACSLNRASSMVAIEGWCRASRLGPYLPTDGAGRWTEARVKIPRVALLDGCPPAV